MKAVAATPEIVNLLRKTNIVINNQKESESESPVSLDDHYVDFSYAQFVPVRVVSGNGLNGYICNIYENGLNEQPTKQGLVFLANGASTIYSLPAGTVMYAQALQLKQIGTND